MAKTQKLVYSYLESMPRKCELFFEDISGMLKILSEKGDVHNVRYASL
jgi:hypothetical protein